MIKVDFKEVGYYVICILFIVVAGNISGITKTFSYDAISNEIVAKVKSTGVEKYLAKETDTSAQKTTNTYGKYRPSYIPKKVLAGSQTSGAWTNLFNSNKKVVFYVYDKNDKFHDEFFNYFSNSDYSKYYDFKPTSKSTFNGMMTGTVGPSKICNSIEECNKYREKASNYTLLTNFLSSCGKGMCIFNSEKNQFVQLRRRTTKDASNMLEELKNW